MTAIDLFDAHEKEQAWTLLWKLTQKDATGQPLYFIDLTAAERRELLNFLRDLLEQRRREKLGSSLGQPDTTPDNRPKSEPKSPRPQHLPPGTLSIHDPALYSFGERRLWISWALDATSGAKRGQYAKGYPIGGVHHWTAGHRNGLKAGNELMRNTGMLYLLGDAEGQIAQSDSLKYHGYHGGKSSHPAAKGYVSDEFVGFEQQAAGMLTLKDGEFYSWYGAKIPKSEVAHSGRDGNIAPGYYHVFTEAQMLAGRKLWVWLYLNDPDTFSIDRVTGHDEVSPGRKVDPGGALVTDPETENQRPLNMSDYRALLWNDVDIVTELKKSTA